MYLLGSRKYSPFGRYRIVDYFKRIELQRGSPHAHILLCLENDPKETVGEKMPRTVKLIDELCSVDPEKLELVRNQTHKHTFTCYKRAKTKTTRDVDSELRSGRCETLAFFCRWLKMMVDRRD